MSKLSFNLNANALHNNEYVAKQQLNRDSAIQMYIANFYLTLPT